MDLYEAMSTLRAVRRLRPDPIPDDVLARVLDATRYAPTGGNRQPWRMVVVRDAPTRAQLGRWYAEGWDAYAKKHRSLLDRAGEDVRRREGKMLAAGDHLAAHYGESPVLVVFCFNPEWMAITDAHLDRPSVVGGGSVYTAVENLLLACRAEGLGCVLTTLLCAFEKDVCRLLEIPEPWGTCAVIPIGYPIHRGHGPVSRRPLSKLAFADRFGRPLDGPS